MSARCCRRKRIIMGQDPKAKRAKANKNRALVTGSMKAAPAKKGKK